MSIFRVEKTKNYTIMSNYHLKEKEMSLKAKGLLSLMLSLPDTWDYTITGLVSICKENATAIKSTLHELKHFGYLQVAKKFPNETNTGRIEYEYIIYEKPMQQNNKNQDIENLYIENQPIENHRQLNTKKLNTKKLNTNNNIYNVELDTIAKEKKEELELNIQCVIDYLNESIGTRYKPTTKETVNLITARFNDGYQLKDFYAVIDKKTIDWKNTEFEQYLRPSTLFGNKFETYLNQKVYFKGTPKINYNSKPTFDNTSSHNIQTNNLPIDQYNKLSLEDKIKYLSNIPIADMTPEQKAFFNENCLAKDENGNIYKF